MNEVCTTDGVCAPQQIWDGSELPHPELPIDGDFLIESVSLLNECEFEVEIEKTVLLLIENLLVTLEYDELMVIVYRSGLRKLIFRCSQVDSKGHKFTICLDFFVTHSFQNSMMCPKVLYLQPEALNW